MGTRWIASALLALGALWNASAQGTIPTFHSQMQGHALTFAGNDPSQPSQTEIPTIVVPLKVTVRAAAHAAAVQKNAAGDVNAVEQSPLFTPYAFGPYHALQYGDALLRAAVPHAAGWHTALQRVDIRPVEINIAPGSGYVLTSVRTHSSLAVLDADEVQRQIFQALGAQPGKLVIAFAEDATFYTDGDATICCSWGTHGIDKATGTSFVLSTYLRHAPDVVRDQDVQPITQQLAEFLLDPLHDPQRYGYNVVAPGNEVPFWSHAQNEGGCGGNGIATSYFWLDPTDTNPKNSIPESTPYEARTDKGTFHLQNAALPSWYLRTARGPFSFPAATALTSPSRPCIRSSAEAAHAQPATPRGASSGTVHRLIGYWTGHGEHGQPFRLRDVSPQWDVVIVAFAAPSKDTPEGTLTFRVPEGLHAAEFRSDVAALKGRGTKVMLSLGGGGAYFHLDDSSSVQNFVSSVARAVQQYGFDGVDIDFETPSLVLKPGDDDFRHPTTPSIVNTIAGLRQLHDQFGQSFMISLVPEGPQVLAGGVAYGGQFGSYLPLIYGLRDILSFVDAQDYNTPPLQGLDGEIYQSHSVDYHAAMTDLLLNGFDVAGVAGNEFPAFPQEQVAVGFLAGYTDPVTVERAMEYLITGKPSAGSQYRLRHPEGYPRLIGPMFWTIDDDRMAGGIYSNLLGPELHGAKPWPAP